MLIEKKDVPLILEYQLFIKFEKDDTLFHIK